MLSNTNVRLEIRFCIYGNIHQSADITLGNTDTSIAPNTLQWRWHNG